MKRCKRLLVFFMAFVILISCISVASVSAVTGDEIVAQIKTTYTQAKKKAGRSSFNGYCATYVNWQLVLLGINTKYIGGNGNREYDNYCNKTESSGGYSITAYPAKSYSLKSALNQIASEGNVVTNILVGFEKGAGSAGKKYGHTCFIHAIIDGKVYYSESYSAKVGGKKYAEGAPIICSISDFCKYYNSWATLDGVIHFSKEKTYMLRCINNYGGKNYLWGTDFIYPLEKNPDIIYSRDESVAKVSIDEETQHNGYNSLKIVNTVAGDPEKDLAFATMTNDRKENGWIGDEKAMTMSFWAKASEAGAKIYFRWGYEAEYRNVTLTKDWAYYTIPMNKTATNGSAIHPYVDHVGTVWLAELQLEDGTKATSFVPENYQIVYARPMQTEGQKYQLPAEPVREGYTFAGWFTAKTGGTQFTAETAVMNGNIAAYARWIPDECKHEFKLDSETAATCEKDGAQKYTCTICGETYTKVLEALGHDYTSVETKPTCTKQGYTTLTCSRCGSKTEDFFVDALGHNFVSGVCTRCGEKDPKYQPEETKPTDPTQGEPTPGGACDGGASCPSYAFKDVNYGDWFHEAVDFAVTKGLFNGMSPSSFAPNTAMSRAMLVTVLWRYAGSPKEGTNTFTDVPNGQWYTEAIAWAAKNGIVTGVGDNKFEPNTNINRVQMAAILYRYSGDNYNDYDQFSERADLTVFPDWNIVSAWGKDAFGWAVSKKLINGNDGRLDPLGNATRAQVATLLMRFIQSGAEPAAQYDPQGHTYGVALGMYSWEDAQEAAQANGGYLVRFDSEEEFKYVTGLLSKNGYQDAILVIGARRAESSKDYYFVDANDKAVGGKINVDSSWTSSHWGPGEPTFSWDGNQEPILALEYKLSLEKWTINDIVDNLTYPEDPKCHGFIVEYDGSAPAETCAHEWKAATCFAPKTCAKCGATEGTKLAHNVKDNKCTLCGHQFFEGKAVFYCLSQEYGPGGGCSIYFFEDNTYKAVAGGDSVHVVNGTVPEVYNFDGGADAKYICKGTWELKGSAISCSEENGYKLDIPLTRFEAR